jgi:hypothetical protein
MLSTSNKKVSAFYKAHPGLDFEKMNVLMVDILSKVSGELSQSMDMTATTEILKDILGKVDKIESTHNLSNQTIHSIQLAVTSQKDSYLSDIKSTIESQYLNHNQTTQMVQDKANEYIVDKTSLLLNDILPKSQSSVHDSIVRDLSTFYTEVKSDTSKLLEQRDSKESFRTIQEIIERKFSDFNEKISQNLHAHIAQSNETVISRIQEQQSAFQEVKLFLEKQKYCNSSTTGKMGEDRLQHILNQCFPSATITRTTGSSKRGDFIIQREDCKNCKILVENKEYTTNIPTKEVTKFIRDIESTKCHGVFLSQNTGIANKKNFEINFHGEYILIYLHNVQYNPDLVASAVQILDIVAEKLEISDFETQQISKEDLSTIQSEFLNFIQQKQSIIELSKKHHREIIQSLESMDFPALSKILSINYSNIECNEHICPECKLHFKNKRALGSHRKGCRGKVDVVEIDDENGSICSESTEQQDSPPPPKNNKTINYQKVM